jgi:hypothetical protein
MAGDNTNNVAHNHFIMRVRRELVYDRSAVFVVPGSQITPPRVEGMRQNLERLQHGRGLLSLQQPRLELYRRLLGQGHLADWAKNAVLKNRLHRFHQWTPAARNLEQAEVITHSSLPGGRHLVKNDGPYITAK